MKKHNPEQDLEDLINEKKDLNQQLKNLPKRTTKAKRKALADALDAIDIKIDHHKQKNIANGPVEIKFTKSPTGIFSLGYNAGDVATLEAGLAQSCIDAGVAEAV